MLLALAVAIASATAPQQDSAAFIKRFVAAINSGSVAQRRALQHPRDTCSARAFIDQIITRQASKPVDANYQWRITKLAVGRIPLEGILTYVVRPTHQLQIDYRPTPYSSTTLLVLVVRSASGWHEVHGCPTKETVARMADAQRKTEQRRQEVGRRVNTMPRAVRDSILALHLNGLTVSAAFYYVAVAKSDTTTADAVVDSVIARHRLQYKYVYPHNTRTLIEDHYIVIDTIDGAARGWYYGTTDDFDTAREGYPPGFFVAPMRELRFARGSIAFSLTLEPNQIFSDPVPYTIRDPRVYAPTVRRWRVARLGGTRTYSGIVRNDSIVLQLPRGRRGFARVK